MPVIRDRGQKRLADDKGVALPARRLKCRAAERLSARGRSKRLLVEPGVTAARHDKFTKPAGSRRRMLAETARIEEET